MTSFVIKPQTSKSIGSRIALLRNEKGLSQQNLADILGVARSLVASWENGSRTPDLENWIELSIFFNVSTDYIAGTSTQRTYKGASLTDKLDLDRLNELGKHMLFEYYHLLIQNKEFLK